MQSSESLGSVSEQVQSKFQSRFQAEPTWVAAAPGRVNLIGEHTDYNDGFVLPMAIERYVVIAASRPLAESDAASDRCTIQAWSELLQELVEFEVTDTMPADLPSWCVYIYGVLDLLRKQGMPCGPLQLSVMSTVPLGGGLSSSAALEVATATLVEAVTGKQLDGREKAKLCQQAENEYVGMPCGIMDQFSSALCQQGEAMRLDCRSLETTAVPLNDPDVTVLITNSNVSHELSSSEYPVRRAQCEKAAKLLGVDSLRDVTPEQLEANKEKLESLIYRRAKHVIDENQRVLDFSKAAELGDWTRCGELMYASHDSLRDDYEVSCPEVDKLVEIAQAIGPEGGVYGSRITGGGFGGCTVTLVKSEAVNTIATRQMTDYQAATGTEAFAFTSRPAQGAHVLVG